MKGHYKSLRETLGLFAPDPNQVPEDPGPATGEITLLGISMASASRAGVTENLRASGPRKPGKSQGKSELFPGDYSLAFPDAKHPGWRLRRRARSITASSQTSAFLSDPVGTNLIRSLKQYPLNGSRGEVPWCRCTRAAQALASSFPFTTQLLRI